MGSYLCSRRPSTRFRLGFHPVRRLKPAKKNKPSAFQNPKVIDDYLAIEVARGRVAGPFPLPPLPNLQVSSFGVIPKKGQPGKWRLIVDLSSPHGCSINDGIDPALPLIFLLRWLIWWSG